MKLLLAGLVLCGSIAAQNSHISKADEFMAQHNYEAAATEFEGALADGATDTVVRYHYAECLFAVGRNEDARRELERVAKQDGKTPEVAYYLGRLDVLEGRGREAIGELQPLAGKAKIADLPYYLGLAYVAAGDAQNGLKWLEQAERSTPRDYHVHYRLARLFTVLERKADADREYKLYLECRDAQKETDQQARSCNDALGEKAGAIPEACRTLQDPNDPEKLVLLGQLLGEHADFQLAIEPLQKAAETDPKSFDAWQNLGLSYFRLQQYRQARGPLEKAAALRPDFFDTLNLLGATLYMLGEDRAAVPVLERAHQLRPGDAQLGRVLEQLRAPK